MRLTGDFKITGECREPALKVRFPIAMVLSLRYWPGIQARVRALKVSRYWKRASL